MAQDTTLGAGESGALGRVTRYETGTLRGASGQGNMARRTRRARSDPGVQGKTVRAGVRRPTEAVHRVPQGR